MIVVRDGGPGRPQQRPPAWSTVACYGVFVLALSLVYWLLFG